MGHTVGCMKFRRGSDDIRLLRRDGITMDGKGQDVCQIHFLMTR